MDLVKVGGSGSGKGGDVVTPLDTLLGIGDDGRFSARSLYDFFGFRPKDFSRWAKSRILNDSFATEGQEYTIVRIDAEHEFGGTKAYDDYRLSGLFAKYLCMRTDSPRGAQAVAYFVKMEQIATKNQAMINSMSIEMRGLMMLSADVEGLKKQNASQQMSIEANTDDIDRIRREVMPKVDSYDAFLSTEGWFSFSEVSKMLDVPHYRLMRFLRDRKVLMSHKSRRNHPYEPYAQNGLFTLRRATDGPYHDLVTLVSKKGINFVRKQIKKYGPIT